MSVPLPGMLGDMAEAKVKERITADVRRRRFASDKRAGRYARRKALRLQEQFIRETWKFLLVLVLLPDLLLPGVWLVRPVYRGFLIGLILPVGVWIAAGVVLVFSGASSTWMGQLGEVWTAQELRRARRHGWEFVNDLFLAGQIDHVALGPAGLLVIETKWAAEPWPLDNPTDWRRQKALRAVTEQVAHVRSIMISHHSDVPVIPVVVRWRPPTEDDPGTWHRDGNVFLVDGPSFKDWLASLPSGNYDLETARAAWDHLIAHIEPRDRHIEATQGPAPRTILQLWWRVAEPILVALIALYCSGSVVRLLRPSQALLAVAGVAMLGFIAALWRPVRRIGIIWGGTILTAYTLALIVVLIRHWAH